MMHLAAGYIHRAVYVHRTACIHRAQQKHVQTAPADGGGSFLRHRAPKTADVVKICAVD
jgi:hypothetical protein